MHSEKRSTIKTVAIMAYLLAGGVVGVGILQAHDADAQGKAPKAEAGISAKDGLKRALTMDIATVEAQARAAWDTLIAAKEALATAEASVAAAAVGTKEYDAATESWLAAQGVLLLAQEDFNLAARAHDAAKTERANAATTFVDERCANDDGKNADITRVCSRLAAAKAEAAAKGAAAAEAASKVPGARVGP